MKASKPALFTGKSISKVTRSVIPASIAILLLIWSFAACDGVNNRPPELAAYDSTQYQRVSMNYEILGDQDTCLIFIHGWNLNMRYWDDQVKYFQSRYRILNLDLAGHGNSGKDRHSWTVENFARDIVHIMEKESINKAILVGHSIGGNIALQITATVPDKIVRIVAVDCFKDVDFEITDEFREGFTARLAKFKRNYAEMADEFARENTRTKNRDVINRIVRDYRSADPKVALAVYRNVVQKHAEEKDQLRKLPFKLYLINSDYLPINESALRKYALHGYEILPVYGVGHFPMVEQPEQMNVVLDSALAR